MNREIKFRFWTGSEMIADIDGWSDWVGINEMFTECTVEFGYKTMQFTGLMDKNGVEIYEGDVTDAFEKIVFENGAFRTAHKDDNQLPSLITETRCRYITIIGNIYEHPDLLK